MHSTYAAAAATTQSQQSMKIGADGIALSQTRKTSDEQNAALESRKM
jgi:hypothetical protein